MQTYYFNEPRLTFTAPGEFMVRLVTYAGYILFSGTTALFAFSGISSLEWLAALLALFLVDRLLHVGEAERSLAECTGERVNLAEAVTPASYRILRYATRKARALGEDMHLVLLYELAQLPDIQEALKRLGVESNTFLSKVNERVEERVSLEVAKEHGIQTLIEAAFNNARDLGEKFIHPRNIFVALAGMENPVVKRLFEVLNVSIGDLREAIIFGRWRKRLGGVSRLPTGLGGFVHRPGFLRHRTMNRAWTARPTRTLDAFSTDLTDLARAEQIGLLIGHEKEFDDLLNIIARPGKPNALLVGPPGIGMSTMLAHLAFRMIKDDVPPVLFDKRLVSLEISSMISSATPEVLSGRIQKIVEEILTAGNIVLFIPNIHDLFRTTAKTEINAIDILLPVIKSEAIPLIGETYPREFAQYVEPRSDFLEQFEVIRVQEISEEESVRFLVYSGLLLERQFNILITFRAIRKAVELAHRYFHQKPLPGSALDLLKQALGKASQERLGQVDEDTVIAVAERQSKIPIQKADDKEAEKLLNLEELIHKKLINQEASVRAVSRALREYRSGLTRQGGPIATFLFVGPTGVGKTELAKILTNIQFGSKDLMHRFDMSEYQDKQSIFRFIGTPDGERTGALTDAVLREPYSLVLLDEFEKAHPDILNLFLQVFDDGRLTDSLGRTVDFQNTIIIATSNANSDFIKEEIEKGRTTEDISDELKKRLTTYFRPELINRFSDVIVFRSLNIEEILSVAKLLVADVADLLRETHGIELTITDVALRKLSELGYDPVFGARPLRQVISDNVRSPLADKILRKEIARGNVLELELGLDGDTFSFKLIS